MFNEDAAMSDISLVVVYISPINGNSEGGHVRFRVSLPFIDGESELSRIPDPNVGYSVNGVLRVSSINFWGVASGVIHMCLNGLLPGRDIGHSAT